MNERWFLIFLILIVTGLLALNPLGIASFQKFLFSEIDGSRSSSEADLALVATALKAELAALSGAKEITNEFAEDYQPAFIYSRYPFNFKNEILVSAGADDGVVVGQPVVLPINQMDGSEKDGVRSGVFLGRVIKTFSKSALVQTVFDNSFQLAVRIGPKGVDALFVGGAEPRLSIVPKTAIMEPGMSIYSAAPGMTYGLPIGEVGDVRLAADHLFQEANVRLGYDINDVRLVLVSKARVE